MIFGPAYVSSQVEGKHTLNFVSRNCTLVHVPRFRQLEPVTENLDLSLELFLPLLSFLFGHFQSFQIFADLSKLLLEVDDFVLTC